MAIPPGGAEESSGAVIKREAWELGNLGLNLCQLWDCDGHHQGFTNVKFSVLPGTQGLYVPTCLKLDVAM